MTQLLELRAAPPPALTFQDIHRTRIRGAPLTAQAALAAKASGAPWSHVGRVFRQAESRRPLAA